QSPPGWGPPAALLSPPPPPGRRPPPPPRPPRRARRSGPTRRKRAGRPLFGLPPPQRREVVLDHIPLRLIFVPVTHHFVHTTTAQKAGQTADVIVEMTIERISGRRQFQPGREARDVAVRSRPARDAGDVAVERLHHS